MGCCIFNNSAGVVECLFIKQYFFRDCVAVNVKKVNYFRGGFHTIFTQFSHNFHKSERLGLLLTVLNG